MKREKKKKKFLGFFYFVHLHYVIYMEWEVMVGGNGGRGMGGNGDWGGGFGGWVKGWMSMGGNMYQRVVPILTNKYLITYHTQIFFLLSPLLFTSCPHWPIGPLPYYRPGLHPSSAPIQNSQHRLSTVARTE